MSARGETSVDCADGADLAPLLAKLRRLLGADAVCDSPARCLPYDSDAMPLYQSRPAAVLLPGDEEAAAAVLQRLHAAGVPWTPRGAGTGLSGGAIAPPGGMLISTARMRRIREIGDDARRACVAAGVVNLTLDRRAALSGLAFAPDPSSEAASTIGGNIATGAGGPHTLKYGATAQHLLGVRMLLADGSMLELGGAEETMAGYDLLALVCGSEGTFGLVTEATLRLIPRPEATRTFLAAFDQVAEASRAVAVLLRAGIVPAALEMIDATVLTALEEAFGAGLPPDAAALLVGELDGLAEGVDAQLDSAARILTDCGGRELRVARSEAERQKLWQARKQTFGALGRVTPNYLSHDVVIPRSALPEVLAQIAGIGRRHRLRIANVFHAGDGNLHPAVLFDDADAGERERARQAGEEIVKVGLAAGGVLTGEHGIGLSKREAMRWVYTPGELQLLGQLRRIFDPWGLVSPGRVLPPEACEDPTAEGARRGFPHGAADLPERAAECETGGEVAAPPRPLVPADDSQTAAVGAATGRRPRAWEQDVVSELHRAYEQWETIMPLGGGTLTIAPPAGDPLPMRKRDRILRYDPVDTAITVEPGVTLAMLEEAVAAERQQLAWEAPDPDRATIGGVVAAGYWSSRATALGHPKHSLLGVRAVTGRGEVIAHGGRVVKNVSGYDLARLLVGSRGTLAVLTRLTLRTYPLPALSATAVVDGAFADLRPLARRIAQAPLGWSRLDLLAAGESSRLHVDLDGLPEEVQRRRAELGRLVTAAAETAGRAGSLRLGVLEGEQAQAARKEAAAWLQWDSAPLIVRLVVAPRHTLALADLAQANVSADRADAEAPTCRWRMQCHPLLGLIRFSFHDVREEASLRRLCLHLADAVRESKGHRALDRAPEDLWWGWDPWGAPRRLAERMRRIKLAFDPRGVLAPWLLEGWTRGL